MFYLFWILYFMYPLCLKSDNEEWLGSAKYFMITYNFQILKTSILNSISFVNRFIFMYLFILKSFGIIFWISEEILCGWKMFLIISFGFETTSKTVKNWESLFHTKFLQKANNKSITWCLLSVELFKCSTDLRSFIM